MSQKPVKQKSEQARKFVDAARKLGADGDPKAFDRALQKLSKAPPPETVKERKRDDRKDKPE